MVETVGKKLLQARQRKQISVEEAARATRMRPDKIVDLENDNYTNFPNMTYAKGFLLIYAKFLQVDVVDFSETLTSTNPVGIEDYEYLNASERRQEHAVYRPQKKRFWPLVLTSLIVLAGAAVMYFILTIQRLAVPEPAVAAAASPTPTVVAQPSAATVTKVAASPVPAMTESAAGTPRELAPKELVPKDVVLKPLKKTWVKITRDVADSPPIFEDWLFPDARALKFRGVRFWIEIKDGGALEITRDGQPVAANSSKVTIE